jgi:plasmid segregation protein ParM
MKNIAGINTGYGWTKAISGAASVCFESVIAPATDLKFKPTEDMMIGGNGGVKIGYHGQEWFVGSMARLHSSIEIEPRARARDKTMQRVLTLAALYKLGIKSGEVNLVTGLPVRWYEQDKDELAAMLMGTHGFAVEGVRHSLYIPKVVVVPEAFGTYYKTIVNENGVFVDAEGLRNADVGILDIGTFTTNYIHIAPGPRYAEDGSHSIKVGMGRVYEQLQETVYARCERELSFREAEDLVINEQQQIRGKGKMHSIADLIGSALSSIATAILSEAKTQWGYGDGLAAILVTGGGGQALFPYVQQIYSHAHLVDDPQMANAQGFHRYAIRKFIAP